MRLFSFLLFVIFLATIEVQIKAFFGWSPDFVLLLLLAAAPFVPFVEIVLASGLSALLLLWQPPFGISTLVLVILPTLSWFAAKPRISRQVIILCFAVLVFYGSTAPKAIYEMSGTLVLLTAVDVGIGFCLLLFGKWLWERQAILS